MAPERDSKESVLEALGSPVLASFPEELRLTKRNLLFVSAVVFFVKMSGMKIGQENVSLLGLSFSNPGQIWLDVMLLGTIVYLFVQFIWQTGDYAMQTRLRITGTKLSWVTVGKSAYNGADYPEDPQQSTLYYWWREEARKIGNLREATDQAHNAAKAVLQVAKPLYPIPVEHLTIILRPVNDLTQAVLGLKEQLNTAEKALSSERIPISLERFDRWFWGFKKSQIWRTLFLDIALPTLMAMASLAAIAIPYVQEHWPW